MKKIIFLLSCLLSYSVANWWSYPLHEIAKPIASCKFNLWKNLWPNCKIPLPKLTPSMYKSKSKDIYFYRRIYTVLWMWSYKYGWDVMHWSHPGVDIATSEWTPVYSIGTGIVVRAYHEIARWNVVVIQHKVDWKYIYSNYAHLSKILVRVGQKVNQNTKIWEVWHTGNAYWNHLHFQIDTNQGTWEHPRWYHCRWHTISAIVNSTICQKGALKNTLDPLAFLATNGAIIKYTVTQKIRKQPKISRKNIISREVIQKQIVEEFLRTHKISFHFSNAWVYYFWKYGSFTIWLKDMRWRNYNDILPDNINIIYNKSFFSAVSPIWIKIIDGSRKVTFIPKKTWTTFFTIKMWNQFLYQKTIRIVKVWQTLQVKHGSIITFPRNKYIWQPVRWINIFQDAWYMNIIKVPFAWRYRLTSSTKDVVFCKAWTDIKYLNYFKCNIYNTSKWITFSYKDTIFGLLVFKFYSDSGKPTKLLVQDEQWKTVSQSRTLYFKPIRFVDTRSVYNPYIISACKKWLCLWILDRWYFWNTKKVSKTYAKYILANMMNYLWKKVKYTIPSIDNTEYVTRWEFVDYVFKMLWLKIKNYNEIPTYIDVRNQPKELQNDIVYLTKLWFSWKDRFAKYHFQPNKVITEQEALYFVEFLLEKFGR